MKSIKIEIWEKYLEKILKNSQVSITVTDMEGNFIIFSKGAEFLTGYSADEVVGKMKVKDFYANSEDAERIAAEVVKSDLIENFETLIKRKDGRAVPINIFVSLLRDDDGNPIGSIGVSVDISEKKRLQEKLRLSEEKYRILVEQSNDAIYILQEGKFVYINPKFKEILGYSLEETTAENFNFMNLVARESRPMIEERARKVEKGESLPLRYEFKGLSKEKEIIEFEVAVNYIKYGGKPAVLGVLRDITERKRAEREIERLKEYNESIVDNAPIGIITIDRNGTIIHENPEMVKILGGKNGEKPLGIGKKIYELPNVIEAGLEKYFWNIMKGERVRNLEFPFISLYGKEMIISVDAVPLVDKSGNVEGAILLIQDVTERKKMEEQLIQSEKLRALGEMAGGVAHDFNNILGSILGRAQLLKMNVMDPEVRTGLETIEKAAIDGADTVKRIQEFTRVRKDTEFVLINLNEIVEDAISFTRTRWKDEAEAKGIKIEIVKNLQNVEPVSGSASGLREVLTNVIFNSIDALPKGGRIILTTKSEGNYSYLIVEDNGVGMTREVCHRAFDPFFTTKGVKGVGLGLSVSYGIISRHKGEIVIDSRLNEGTKVTVKLPVASEKPIKEEKKEERIEPQEASILVIDDEEHIRKLLYDILVVVGYNVDVAASGIEGIKLFEKGHYDLVITDLGMAEMSGWEVSRKVKNMNSETVVVLLTGWGTQLDDNQIQNSGIDRIISKPFQVNQILRLISECIGRKVRG